MTNQEKLRAIRKVQGCIADVRIKLADIIRDTSDHTCDNISEFNVGDSEVYVVYWWSCRGEHGTEEAIIPIEWLDEGFDYKAAYKEKCRQAELARIREEKKEKKRLESLRKAKAKLEKEQEYKKYLTLKKKYEGGTK